MWVKAGPPVTSPRAYTPETFVSSRSFTLIQPRSWAMPAPSRPRSSCVGPAARREENPCGLHMLLALSVVAPYRDMHLVSSLDPGDLGPELEGDPLGLERLLQHRRDVRVFARHDLVGELHDRHAAPEPPEHLPELQAHIAGSDDQQMLRHLRQIHDRAIREIGN